MLSDAAEYWRLTNAIGNHIIWMILTKRQMIGWR